MSAAVTIPANLADGRWAGRWFEIACMRCGAMLAMREPPPREGACCASCRGDDDVSRIQQTLADLTEERNAWKARALKAEHELRDACDTIAELQAMVERAHTGASR
jgi:hypothetical protein